MCVGNSIWLLSIRIEKFKMWYLRFQIYIWLYACFYGGKRGDQKKRKSQIYRYPLAKRTITTERVIYKIAKMSTCNNIKEGNIGKID